MRKICILILLFCSLRASAADGDSVRHVGFSVSLMPHWQIAMDQYERMATEEAGLCLRRRVGLHVGSG